MNERFQELHSQAVLYFNSLINTGAFVPGPKFEQAINDKFAELIIKDMAKELFVVYPGGKRGSNVEFQNISMRQWIKQIYGVDLDI